MEIALSARFKYIYTKVAGLGVLHVRRNVVATRQCAVMGARLGAIVLGAAREQRGIINNLYIQQMEDSAYRVMELCCCCCCCCTVSAAMCSEMGLVLPAPCALPGRQLSTGSV